jgi:hypothetical protein
MNSYSDRISRLVILLLMSLYFLSLEYHYHVELIYHLFIFYLTYPYKSGWFIIGLHIYLVI